MVTVVRHRPAGVACRRALNGHGAVIELATARDSRGLAELIYESAAADERAFVDLYDATATRVYGLAARILRSPTLAEEATLEAYLEVWRTSARFSGDQHSPIAWMLAIVLRRVVDRLDAAGNAVRPASPVPAHALGHGVEATSEEVAHLLEALACLGPAQLEAVESACRDEGAGDEAETVRLCTILSTLVNAGLPDDLRRMDGTTYSGSRQTAPGRGASGDS